MSSFRAAFGVPTQNVDNTDGRPLLVTSSAPITGALEFNSISSVSNGVDTNLLVYTVPTGKVFTIEGISCTGTSDGIYKLYIDSVEKAHRRTAWTERNASFAISQIKYSEGTEIKVTVRHNESAAQDFVCDLFGFEDDA